MKRSNLKVSIEYHTRGMNVKEEHFSNQEEADSLFRIMKLVFSGNLMTTSMLTSIYNIEKDAYDLHDEDHVDDDGMTEETTDTRARTSEDDKRIECDICKCTYEDWQTASCHLSKYHLYNCDGLKTVPPNTTTISALWYNVLTAYADTVSDKYTMEDKFREYVLKHHYDWTIDELTDGAYSVWWNTLKDVKSNKEERTNDEHA